MSVRPGIAPAREREDHTVPVGGYYHPSKGNTMYRIHVYNCNTRRTSAITKVPAARLAAAILAVKGSPILEYRGCDRVDNGL